MTNEPNAKGLEAACKAAMSVCLMRDGWTRSPSLIEDILERSAKPGHRHYEEIRAAIREYLSVCKSN